MLSQWLLCIVRKTWITESLYADGYSFTLGVIGVVASAPQMPRPVSANYFRSANTASGLTSGRPSTSVPLCASLPATTQRKTRFTGRRRPFPVQPEVEKWRKPRRELARHDFLYDFNTIYGRICHRLAARNYFRSGRRRKWRNQTPFNVQEDPRTLQWDGGSHFRFPKTASGRVISISGLTSGRRMTSAAHLRRSPGHYAT